MGPKACGKPVECMDPRETDRQGLVAGHQGSAVSLSSGRQYCHGVWKRAPHSLWVCMSLVQQLRREREENKVFVGNMHRSFAHEIE